MMIPFLIAKIHRATVTGTNLDYHGSIEIDEELMETANLRENQKVEIYNITSGSRLSTYVICGKRESKDVVLNGAAAHLVKKGDKIIIAAYGLVDERELNTLHSRVLIMNDDNGVERIIDRKV
jgi:aspartate 1-decarboxylase